MLKSCLLAGAFLITSNFMHHPVARHHIKRHSAPAVVHVARAVRPVPVEIPRPVETNEQPVEISDSEVITAPSPSFESVYPASGVTSEEQEFVNRINAERSQRHLGRVTIDPLLVRVARSHSREMCSRDYFDHRSPTRGLTTPMDRYVAGLRQEGLQPGPSLLIGENIFYCSFTDETHNAAFGHKSLMDSPGHRANILEPEYSKIGVGIYRNSKGEFWVTEEFLCDHLQ